MKHQLFGQPALYFMVVSDLLWTTGERFLLNEQYPCMGRKAPKLHAQYRIRWNQCHITFILRCHIFPQWIFQQSLFQQPNSYKNLKHLLCPNLALLWNINYLDSQHFIYGCVGCLWTTRNIFCSTNNILAWDERPLNCMLNLGSD